MIRKIRCSHCGKTYWQGRAHTCPAGSSHSGGSGPERLGDAVAEAGCVVGRLGCCLLELLPFGCLLPLAIVLALFFYLNVL